MLLVWLSISFYFNIRCSLLITVLTDVKLGTLRVTLGQLVLGPLELRGIYCTAPSPTTENAPQ